MKSFLLIIALCMLSGGVVEAQVSKGKKASHRKQHRRAKPTYYYNSDGTLTSKPARPADSRGASPYKGDNVPANDGQKKNEHRNMNYNSGQPLPSNSGK